MSTLSDREDGVQDAHETNSERRLRLTREALKDLQSEINRLSYPPLGHGFNNLEGAGLSSALVSHRLTSKYVEPDANSMESLASISIQNMILQDNCGPTAALNWFGLEERVRLDLLRAKHEIASLVAGFKLPRTATRFPSGESTRSSGGEIAFAPKFSQDEQWTCSPGCLSYAADLCYNTPPLKKMVKERARALYPARFFDYCPQENPHLTGRETFHRMFRSVVDIETARFSAIPKDNEWMRVISMETTFSMICQLAFSDGLRNQLKSEWGYEIDKRDRIHNVMIADPTKVTIDLRNASNSHWLARAQDLWPKRLFDLMKRFRSDVFSYKGKHGGEMYHSPKMLSPMGNGFTFEVMTITLLAMVRSLDPTGSVYGDDIIIAADKADRLFAMLDACGWQVNTSKTFTTGNFRESCGGFYDLVHKDYLLSYDMWYPEDEYDCIVNGNKLYRILHGCKLEPALRRIILRCWIRLWKAYSDFHTLATPDGSVTGDGFFSPSPTDLPVNRRHNEMYDAMYQRRPRWRLSCRIDKHHSKMETMEWTRVAAMLLGQAEKPPSRERRRVYVAMVDDITGEGHPSLAAKWMTKVVF